jgi:N6-L-threonylcarbamoyladenine synthase
MIHSGDLDFSFSGLKTAVANLVQKLGSKKVIVSKTLRADIAASFQNSITEVLMEKCCRALQKEGAKSLIIAGGVGANTELRRKVNERAKKFGFEVYYPPLEFCTDNGAMVALVGGLKINEGIYGAKPFDTRPRWPLDA